VNEFSLGLGEAGRRAVRTLLEVHARTAGGAAPPDSEVFSE
jgi:hypothetical protein